MVAIGGTVYIASGSTLELTTASDSPEAFDIDEDGTPDVAVLNDEMVTIPVRTQPSWQETWLPFAGSVLAAALGGGAAIAVAVLHRRGEKDFDELREKIRQLEERVGPPDEEILESPLSAVWLPNISSPGS